MGFSTRLKSMIAIKAPSNPLKAAPANNSHIAQADSTGIGGCGCGCGIGGSSCGKAVGRTVGSGGERASRTSAA
jgi:F0F1-type ATP synthase membrane subunit c/vacuolar-type H+-ATPase subunit K